MKSHHTVISPLRPWSVAFHEGGMEAQGGKDRDDAKRSGGGGVLK